MLREIATGTSRMCGQGVVQLSSQRMILKNCQSGPRSPKTAFDSTDFFSTASANSNSTQGLLRRYAWTKCLETKWRRRRWRQQSPCWKKDSCQEVIIRLSLASLISWARRLTVLYIEGSTSATAASSTASSTRVRHLSFNCGVSTSNLNTNYKWTIPQKASVSLTGSCSTFIILEYLYLFLVTLFLIVVNYH